MPVALTAPQSWPRLLQAPVLLMINATKVTRTAAAWVLGCRHLDPEVRIGGVILNHVNGARHERVIRDAIESTCEPPRPWRPAETSRATRCCRRGIWDC